MKDETMIVQEILGKRIELRTDLGLFSPGHVDRGTLAMLSRADFMPGMQVMDLGCGCGVVGIIAALICGAQNVVMSDIDPVAVRTARENAARNGVGEITCILSDGFARVDRTGFDLILSNPPYQSDFSVAKAFIEKGFNRLKPGGRMLMVTKRRTWYRNKLSTVFGGVKIYDIDGYYVFEAQKRTMHYARGQKSRPKT